MKVREAVIGELMALTPEGVTPQITKDGIAFATKNRKIEYVLKLKNFPGKKVKKLAGFLSSLAILIDERFFKKLKNIYVKVVVYDSAMGIKVYKGTNRKTEVAEIVYDSKSNGSKIIGVGEFGNPEFVGLAIDIIKEYAGTIGVKI